MKKIIIMALLLVLSLIVSACSNKYVCPDGSKVSDSSLCPKLEPKFAGWVDLVTGCTDSSKGMCGEKGDCNAEFGGYIENKGNTVAQNVKVICDGHPKIEKYVGDINIGQKIDVKWYFKQNCVEGGYPAAFGTCFLDCLNCGEKRFFAPSRSREIT